MRSITNVYIISLCLADFMYLANLTLVATAQLNDKSWIFGRFMCTLYHGTETTGKYASVIFVVLLTADRYCAICCTALCARYRNYCIAISLSVIAWILAFSAAIPLYLYSEVVQLQTYGTGGPNRPVCIAKWPSLTSARWYITFSSILIYVAPLALMTYFNYHVLKKLQKALRNSKRMRRTSKSRAPYHRVTRLVLCVVIFHAACWSPFWLFNLLSSVFQFRIHTRFSRLIVNVIHLFPYINCALNPLLIDPYVVSLPFLHRFVATKRRFGCCNERNHSILARPPLTPSNINEIVVEHVELNKLTHPQSRRDDPNEKCNNYLLPWFHNNNVSCNNETSTCEQMIL
ncbi:unnamed protein product [Acanthocheilonema viteae]|uniref:G-protein coupled receptors family 1 profile domain-containing protein n=1 Tax=Acanthocheilonema viteae TaxID=6277 RepID=A0A498SCD9_ACAVI|nr:unnamed protein product [Acanthocheilonema viteae]